MLKVVKLVSEPETERKSNFTPVFHPLHFLPVLLEKETAQYGVICFKGKKPRYLLILLSVAGIEQLAPWIDFTSNFPKVDMDVTVIFYLTWYLIYCLKV